MKIVFLDADTLGDVSLSPIESLGELCRFGTSTAEQARLRVRDAEVLIVNKVIVSDSLMECAPGLRLICEAATGVNNIDLEAAATRNIEVRNVAGYSTSSVVQLTFTQLLSLAVNPMRFDHVVKSGGYFKSGLFTDVSSPWQEVSGKTMGIIGMGTIGHKVADVASVMGMNVIYYSTSGTNHCSDYPCADLDELLEKSDFVSIHCPLNERTRGLISRDQLCRMKGGTYIINMARGGIINEADLADALDKGVIAGAALDVFSEEPLPPSNPLMNMKHPERILLTPHVAWASSEAIVRLVDGVARNIRSFYATT